MKNKILFLVFALYCLTVNLHAQRKVEKLDRGVVAVRNNASGVFVSWRFLATDPEEILFNLYFKNPSASSYLKLNSSPQKTTSFVVPNGTLEVGAKLYVTTVLNGVESTPSGYFTLPGNGFTTYRSAYLDIAFSQAKDGLDVAKYSMKFCWPADLDGDGEFDFVVDRLSTNGGSHKVQGYLRNGTYLWTIDMGPNCPISQGSSDMVVAYDMDGDGKAEVMVKSSDGTSFADGKGVFGSTSLDTDNDGIVNYELQSVKNPPSYMTVVNGLTGLEKNSVEMNYPAIYTRTNKAVFMGEEYNKLIGHMGIAYLDGKHPSLTYIYAVRTLDGSHKYFVSAWKYDADLVWKQQWTWERGSLDAAEGHGMRIADVDLDGRDEIVDIGYGIKYDGTLAYNAHISHGDRFRTGDIDPDRPGLETFAIQQNASSMLGQILYEASTGKPIRKYFMSSVGDVGRGECMDVDSTRLGYEFWSTMSNMYDAKGNVLFEGTAPWPSEGLWWDGELDREELAAADGSGFNADVRKYSMTGHSFGSRLIEFAKMTSWQVHSSNGVRPAFFGDIAGDWREEVLLEKTGTASVVLKDVNGNDSIGSVPTSLGMVGFSTDYPTTFRQYCLMQNPAYRMQATTKGYYQSPMTDFYLGYQMPTAPIAPVQKAKLTWLGGNLWDKTSSAFVLDDEKTAAAFVDGDDVMFDLSGLNTNEITLPSVLSPSKVWAMNPKGHDYTLTGTGKLTGVMELVKSMNGVFKLNGNHDYTGRTRVSEGTLIVNGTLSSPVFVLPKGTLGGNAVLNGALTVQPGLNIEGGRLSPGNGLGAGLLGKMTVNGNLKLPGKANIELDILPADPYLNDSLMINGDLTVSGVNTIVVKTESGVLPSGSYSLLKWTGTLTGSLANFTIGGISGLPMALVIENQTLKLVVNATRAASNVVWSGKESGSWDFLSANFGMNGTPTFFVNGDTVEFNDTALVKIVTLNSMVTTAKTVFKNESTFTVKGTGGITGSGDLIKTGNGLLDIQSTTNAYTGKTVLKNALMQVASLADAGIASSLGSAVYANDNLSLTDSRLLVNAVSTNSNRGVVLLGTDTIQVPKSNGVVTLTGLISGSGKLVKNGPGQLNISGSVANTYNGGTVINGSTVALGSLVMNTSGLGSGSITLENGGKLIMYYSQEYGQKPVWNLTIPAGSEGSLTIPGRCYIAGNLTGAGNLTYKVPYVRGDWAMNSTNFSGNFNVTTSDADGGDFRITANPTGLPLSTVTLANLIGMGYYATEGASSTNTATTVRIGALAGAVGSKLSGGNWQIGSNNKDAVFNGTISAAALVTKIGTGSWTLTGSNLCTSTFSIVGGKLIAANTSGSATGTSPVVVYTGGTLAGTGTIGGAVILNAGGFIAPGNGSIGTLNLSSNLTLQSGSNWQMKVNGATNDKVLVSGALTLKGTLNIINQGATFKEGDAFTMLSGGTVTGMFDLISPTLPGEGLEWDQSELVTKGIIKVVKSTALNTANTSGLRFSPNPIHNELIIVWKQPEPQVNVILFNTAGTMLYQKELQSPTNVLLPVNNLQPGVYFLKLKTLNGTIEHKFIKK